MSSFSKPAKLSITTDSLTEVIAAQGARSFINVHSMSMSNSSATATTVDIYDGATVEVPGFSVPAGLAHTVNLSKPWRLSENSALSIKAGTAVSTLNITFWYDVEPSGNG